VIIIKNDVVTSERFKSGWINSFFYIAPRFLEAHVKQSQVPDLVSNFLPEYCMLPQASFHRSVVESVELE